MNLQLVSFFRSLIQKGHTRSVKAKKTIIYSFIYRGLSIVTTLILVPVTLKYLNSTNYGIWITISTIIAWFVYFDVGLGNGMRNKFAEAVAKDDHTQARIYVSTTYALIVIIFSFILIIFLFINPILNWVKILNAPPEMALELRKLALVVFVFFCFQMVFKLLGTVVTANQEAEKASLYGFLGNLISLILVYLLTITTSGDLLLVGIVYSISPVLVLLLASFWVYNHKYKLYTPSLKHVKLKYIKDLMNLGIKFFVIQASLIILIQASNVIIAQIFGPEEVTKFNIAFRYFNVVIMFWWIFISPIWSAITEAWVIDDIAWIKGIIKKLRLFWVALSIGTLCMLAFSNFVYRIWIGGDIEIPLSISASLTFYIITYSYNGIYYQFLNGVGIIRLQLYAGIFSMILYIPLAIFLCNLFGVSGVVLANIFFNSINIIWSTMQYQKIINKKASGIWRR
jgi:O-antigen/teichoic acid export membrane protein